MSGKTCYEDALERKVKRLNSIREVERRMKLPLEEKVEYSRALLREAFDNFRGKIYVACSFGKDSIAVLSLAREVDPDVVVVFSNTGIEHKETYEFRDYLVDAWDLNYVEAKPDRTFWSLVREFGLPKLRYRNKEPACCYYLKVKPARYVIYEHELEAAITGLTAAESYSRRWLFAWYGDAYRTKKGFKYPITKFHPIAYWTERDVWRFTEESELPVNAAYRKLNVDRVGCKFCTGYLGWESQMKRLYPRVYRHVRKLMAEDRKEESGVSSLDDFDDAVARAI